MVSSTSTSETQDFDVAIVGGGIAGPAMACALASTGWRILLVERSADPIDTARGDHLQPKTCEWLAQWGALDELWSRGAEKRLGARYLTADGDTVLDVPADHLDIPHPYFVYLHHERICDALLAVAARNPNFELWRPASALPMQNPDGFGMTVEHDGVTKTVHARLLVAADGRTSRFRRAAGIEAATYAYRNPMLTLFARRTVDNPRNEVWAYFCEAGVLTVVPRIQGGWKMGLPVPPADLPGWRRATPEELGQQFAQWVPHLAGVHPEFAGVYPITSMNAQRWSEKNLVLLGDACNTLHPGRSQGMNVAMRAAHRLAQLLSEGQAMNSGAALREVLLAYEAEVKPPMDARLADNHERGLEMDRLDPQETRALQGRLAAIQADPEIKARYCLASAGY
jgi:2-polyprenyl-6-methoxyphenol hydroxylase-like FAD-dependent oxidoreductase